MNNIKQETQNFRAWLTSHKVVQECKKAKNGLKAFVKATNGKKN